MDPRRLLTLAVAGAMLGVPIASCALSLPFGRAARMSAVLPPAPDAAPAPASPLSLDAGLPDEARAGPEDVGVETARPYLATPDPAPAGPHDRRRRSVAEPDASSSGRAAIAAANRSAREASSADSFVGGVQVFAWRDGRVYEVWTAPLRVSALTLAPGETVTAKAAGDTVRWQIGESQSGSGPLSRTHVLVKPLQSGLETNLILTTSQRVYHLTLRSGAVETFNAAIAWDYGFAGATEGQGDVLPQLPPVDVAVVTPQGPIDARYRIQPRGRTPRWAPIAVFDDGVRTFIALPAATASDEAPALFVRTSEGLHLTNYRQADSLLIVDRLFDAAELRLGERRPQVVRITRLEGAVR